MEPSMTSQEQAELLFKKHDELAGDQVANSEYEQHARAEREKMAKLRALRLARDAIVSADQTKPPAR
jgi:hypothetical protein